MSEGLYDEDGIDGPFDRRMERAMKDDARKHASDPYVFNGQLPSGEPVTGVAIVQRDGQVGLIEVRERGVNTLAFLGDTTRGLLVIQAEAQKPGVRS